MTLKYWTPILEKMLNEMRMHNPNSELDRLHAPIGLVARGLIQLELSRIIGTIGSES